MSELRVNRIQSIDGSSTVEFATGVSGNAEGLRFEPKVTAFDPTNLATGVDRNLTHINVTFDQPIEFSGVGTVRVRVGVATGTVYEEYTCGVSTNLLISGETLRINLTSGTLDGTTNYFVTLPSVGIANTYTQYYKGTENYVFTTADATFNIDGGDYEQIVYNSSSPTNYYKYNIFTTSGIATFSAPSANAEHFAYMLIGGGGGGGNAIQDESMYSGGGGGAGGLVKNYNSAGFDAGEKTVTIGAGGNGVYYRQPQGNPSFVQVTDGNDSTIGPTPVGTITAYGGGRAGIDYTGTPAPSYIISQTNMTPRQGNPGGSGGGATKNGPPAPPTGYTVELIPGGDAVGYPSPAAQGYPGGYTIRSNKPSIDGLSWGGGGGGGAGGAGYNLTPYNPPSDNPKYHMPSTNCRGGNGAPHPEFSAAVLSYINGFPTDTYQKIGPTGLFAGGGGGAVYAYHTQPPYYPGSFTPRDSGLGGPGGGGRGAWNGNSPHPQNGSVYSQVGADGLGGGGGGGFMGNPYSTGNNVPQIPTSFTPPQYPHPTTRFSSAPGGSGGLYIRYAHPGSV